MTHSRALILPCLTSVLLGASLVAQPDHFLIAEYDGATSPATTIIADYSLDSFGAWTRTGLQYAPVLGTTAKIEVEPESGIVAALQRTPGGPDLIFFMTSLYTPGVPATWIRVWGPASAATIHDLWLWRDVAQGQTFAFLGMTDAAGVDQILRLDPFSGATLTALIPVSPTVDTLPINVTGRTTTGEVLVVSSGNATQTGNLFVFDTNLNNTQSTVLFPAQPNAVFAFHGTAHEAGQLTTLYYANDLLNPTTGALVATRLQFFDWVANLAAILFGAQGVPYSVLMPNLGREDFVSGRGDIFTVRRGGGTATAVDRHDLGTGFTGSFPIAGTPSARVPNAARWTSRGVFGTIPLSGLGSVSLAPGSRPFASISQNVNVQLAQTAGTTLTTFILGTDVLPVPINVGCASFYVGGTTLSLPTTLTNIALPVNPSMIGSTVVGQWAGNDAAGCLVASSVFSMRLGLHPGL